MSLLDKARRPRLKDKFAAQALAAEAVREKAEKKDLGIVKVIKKLSPKKSK